MITLAKKKAKITVLVHKNPFDKTSHVGCLIRNTLTMENLLQEIVEKNTGVDYLMVSHAGELFKREILRQLQNGNAVNVLGLGTMYLVPDGAIKGGNNPSIADIPGFRPRFTVSMEAKEAVAVLKPELVVKSSGEPVISRICNLSDGTEEGKLTAGKGVRLIGQRLKTGGTDSGIFFIPVDADGNTETDESKWTAVNTAYLPRNAANTLEFECPSVSPGIYYIAVRTSMLGNGVHRKEALTGVSDMFVTIGA